MLILKDMISHGNVRACYFHPTNNKLCVKVALRPKDKKLLQKDLTNNALFRRTIAPYVPRYYRLVKTNKGIGLIADLIYDDNNALSKRLQDVFSEKKTIPPEVKEQFDDFFSRLLKYHLWFYDFNGTNFLIRRYNNHYQLFFVDTKSLNRNNSWSFLKLEYIIPTLARIRMKRRIQRFYKGIKISLPDRFFEKH